MLFCSMNPLIDIGQIEGGFVMGLGCHLMEDIIYDINTGQVLNDGTWVSALCLLPLDSLREHLFWHWIIIWWKTSVTPTLAGSLTMERGYMCTFLLPQSGLLHHVEDYVYCPWIVWGSICYGARLSLDGGHCLHDQHWLGPLQWNKVLLHSNCNQQGNMLLIKPPRLLPAVVLQKLSALVMTLRFSKTGINAPVIIVLIILLLCNCLGEGQMLKKHTGLSITLINKEFYLTLLLTLWFVSFWWAYPHK